MDENSLTWRDWRHDDEPALLAGFIATYNGAPWFDEWSDVSAATYLSELRANSRSRALVAFVGNVMAAAVFLHARTYQDASEIYIDEFFVFPSFQGQGIGKKLLAAVREHAASIGAEDLTLLTDRDKPAFDFYVRNGFRAGAQQVFMIG